MYAGKGDASPSRRSEAFLAIDVGIFERTRLSLQKFEEWKRDWVLDLDLDVKIISMLDSV